MEKLLQKIAKAKQEIKETKMKKEGKNTYSNYEYFTPSQIEQLVSSACTNNGLITTFSLLRNELGEYGLLTVFDIDTGDKIEVQMATAIPEIKATNIAQQLGGCVTYTERYLKTSFFGIVDNSLDFDTTENTKKHAETKKDYDGGLDLSKRVTKAIARVNDTKTLGELEGIWNSYPSLHANDEFIECVKLQKKFLG